MQLLSTVTEAVASKRKHLSRNMGLATPHRHTLQKPPNTRRNSTSLPIRATLTSSCSSQYGISTNYHQLRILPLATSTAVRFSSTTRDSSALLQVATPSLSAAPSTLPPTLLLTPTYHLSSTQNQTINWNCTCVPLSHPSTKGHFKSNLPKQIETIP
ncbi:hypothetical protein CEXT_135901 [Caerostris extrusa]|uniref:Uncharacterized protein n=1 Tax=Caerostris extrusa TaxID=172846 RepID=A0AAV4MC04_CAEEX|nr:hypothetical protein CEXT_135901 [Caerostris extrusa]